MALRDAWRRLRDETELALDAQLEGTTREGTLRLALANVGERATDGLAVRLLWDDGTDEVEARRQPILPELAPGARETWLVDDLQLDMPAPRSRWRALHVEVGARNASPRRATFTLRLRAEAEAAAHAPTRYAPPACPATSDGSHRFVVQPESHGTPRWEACANCRYARRLPRTLAQDAQERREAALRKARVEAEEREAEARRAREATRGAERAREPREERRAPPPRNDDEMPLAVALHILKLKPGATPADVEAAYRACVKRYHPDGRHHVDDETRALLNELMADANRARERLRRAK